MEYNKIKQTVNESNPWKGLNFYKEGEILYGRDDEIQSLTLYVTNNIQTVLYGKSGIGKSSIINAGVFPIARKEGLFPIPIRLKHDQETSYIEQIKEAFKESGIGVKEILPAIADETESLWEYLHRHVFFDPISLKSVRPLIVLDQFEEFFTLQYDENKKKAFFAELADLLNEVTPQYIINTNNKEKNKKEEQFKSKDSGFVLDLGPGESEDSVEYVSESLFNIVFTIREDFLSYLERYTKYIPVMKSNRYALLPLNEEQAKDIIMKPVPGLVDISVAKLIIEKVTGKTDFTLGDEPEIDVDAAILSLYLSRLYIKKGGDNKAITAELVNQSSKDIIKDFYEESVFDLPERDVEKIEDQLLTYDGRRNNVSKNDLIREGVSKKTINILVEDRKLLRQFSYQEDIRVEFMHDILCPIVNDRIEHRDQLAKEREEQRKREEEDIRRKKEKAEEDARIEKERQIQADKLRKAEEEKQLLLRKQQLQEEENRLLQLKQEEERIRQEKERKEIEEKAIAEKKELEAKALRIKSRNRRYFIIAAGIVLLIIAYIVNEKRQNDWVFSEYYAQFETINGWPVGIGDKLENEYRVKKPLYYKLSYQGSKSRKKSLDGRLLYTDVEVLSSNGSLPNSCRIPMLEWSEEENLDNKARILNNILRQVERIHYSSSENSKDISSEEWFDKDGKILMSVNYFRQPNGGAWAQFYTSNGQNMKIRDNGIDRLKLSWDSSGHIESLMYYDAKGVPREIENEKDIRGYFWERQGNDTIIKYALNQFGLPTLGIPNNTYMTINQTNKTETIFLQSSKIGDKHKHEVACKEGFARMVSFGSPADSIYYYEPDKKSASAVRYFMRDNLGNVTQLRTKGQNTFGFPPFLKYEYQNGLITKEEWLTDENGTPYSKDSTQLFKWEFTYDDNRSITEEKRTDIYNNIAYHNKTQRNFSQKDTIIITREMDIHRNPIFVTRVDTIRGEHTSMTFYGKDQSSYINNYVVEGNDSLKVHRVIVSRENNTITKEYYVYDSLSILPLPTSYDAFHIYAKTYFKRIEEYDNAGNMISLCLEEPDGTIIKNMIYIIQNGQQIGRAAKSIEGGRKPVRCDKWEEDGFLYYKLYYNKDFEEQFCSVTAVDEWEHRSSNYWGKDFGYIKRTPYEFKDSYVDVYESYEVYNKKAKPLFGTPITNRYEQFLYEIDSELSDVDIPYIHILSAKCGLYNKGNQDYSLSDGDRLVQLGNWKIGSSMDLLKEEWFKTMVGGKTVQIVVLRPNETSYTQKTINFTIDKDEKPYIEYHILKMSKEEKNFIYKWLY